MSYLRFIAGDHRSDAALADLVAELAATSDEFAELWNGQNVGNCANGELALKHPSVGRLDLMYESADLRDGNVIKFYHAQPGSPTEAAFALLASESPVADFNR